MEETTCPHRDSLFAFVMLSNCNCNKRSARDQEEIRGFQSLRPTVLGFRYFCVMLKNSDPNN